MIKKSLEFIYPWVIKTNKVHLYKLYLGRYFILKKNISQNSLNKKFKNKHQTHVHLFHTFKLSLHTMFPSSFFHFAAVLLGAQRVSTTAATFSSSFVLEMCSHTGISADIHHENKLTKASYMCPHYPVNAQYLQYEFHTLQITHNLS